MKILILLFNAIPFFQLVTIFLVALCSLASQYKLGLIFLIIYILPPILARICKSIFPIKNKSTLVNSREFYFWWFQFNLQMLYLRLPFLEEILRVVPGLYSLWLRLWGSKIGSLVYWPAGIRILDRSYLVIGDYVVFGADVRLNPHVITKENEKNMLLLDTIIIKKNVSVGGYSLLTAGVCIEEGEALNAYTNLPPFCTWKNGKRIKPKLEE
jgi:hypothetical protein